MTAKLVSGSARFDSGSGLMSFQVEIDEKTLTARFSDVYLQDGFACIDPSVEYESCLAANTERFLAEVVRKYQEGEYSHGATMDFLDL